MSDTGPLKSSFLVFVNRCQAAIGQIPPIGTGDLGKLWLTFGRLPDPLTEPERLMVMAVVADVLTRLRASKRITRVPTWAELRALFDDSSPNGAGRRLAGFRALEVDGPRRGRPGRPNLAREGLRVLAESCCDPNVSLARVAERLSVTAGHLSRVLRRRTGRPFRRHLHDIRTRRAAKLLVESLAVKEVATAVGYTSVSELDRQFRATFGMTPSAYRESLQEGLVRPIFRAAGSEDSPLPNVSQMDEDGHPRRPSDPPAL